MKTIRKAVRTFLINGENVLSIKYTKPEVMGYWDIPGGKIEDNETSEEASIRECKEETGIDIIKQEKVGNMIIEYPNKIFDFDVYICKEYKGESKTTLENESYWIKIYELIKKKEIFATVHMLDNDYINLLQYRDFKICFMVDENHNLLETKLLSNLIKAK